MPPWEMPLRERICGKCTVYFTLQCRPIPCGFLDVSEFLDESKNAKATAVSPQTYLEI